jgi:hypothetical protein
MDGLAWRKFVGQFGGEASTGLTKSCGYSQAVSISAEPLAEQLDATMS